MDTSFEIEIERMIAEAERKAAAGDLDALLSLSELHHDLAMRRHSWEHFNSAETFLRAAVAKGFPAAVDKLNDWETLRYALGRRIARNAAA